MNKEKRTLVIVSISKEEMNLVDERRKTANKKGFMTLSEVEKKLKQKYGV